MKSSELMKPPRHLLRDIPRNVFYKGPGEWTADIEQAMSFSEVAELIAAWQGSGIRDAEVVEHLPGGHFDFHLPVSHCGDLFPGKKG